MDCSMLQHGVPVLEDMLKIICTDDLIDVHARMVSNAAVLLGSTSNGDGYATISYVCCV